MQLASLRLFVEFTFEFAFVFAFASARVRFIHLPNLKLSQLFERGRGHLRNDVRYNIDLFYQHIY